MMRLVPESNEGKVGFYRSHIDAWVEHAEEIGLSDGRAAELRAILVEAEEALRAQRVAQQAAQNATQQAINAIDKLSRYGAGALSVIRSQGTILGDNVFTLAMIPSPSRKKTAIGPPTKPDRFTAHLTNTGWLKLTWKCRSPLGAGGTVYRISRQLNGSGPYEELDTIGAKTFVDRTIPPGTVSVRYKVLPRRSTCAGETGSHTVNLASSFNPPELEIANRAA